MITSSSGPFDQLCLKATISTAWCGAFINMVTSDKFWGIAIAMCGSGAAILLARARNKREAQRQQWDQDEHELRMSLMQRGVFVAPKRSDDE